MNIAIYPGSFDPITNGHLDMIIRSSKLFDKVIVLIANNPNKVCRFSLTSRVRMIKEATKDISNVEVDSFDGLTVNYAKEHNAKAIIRGLRVVSDFEYEWSYAAANEFINKDIEMVFLMAHKELTFISSSTIDELYRSGVDISSLVPSIVIEEYKKLEK
ncbi:MAG: pantetheine-phosphate adenylyltransferase [bacterium]|nr:pantetheine-phosphate adenylyltransferase [bacterium]MDD7616454.1 pantetheine-phosphate adenylyltransferase [bacterium]